MPDPVAPATAAASLYGETPAPAPEPAATPAVEAAVVPTPEPAPVPAPTAEATPAEPPVPAEPAAALEFKPEQYVVKMPEGFADDAALVSEFQTAAAEVKLPPEGAQRLIDLYGKAVGNQIKALEDAGALATPSVQEKWLGEINAMPEFTGERRTQSLAIVGRMMDEFAPPELKTMLDKSGFGNNPAMVKFVLNMAEILTEGSMPAQGRPAPVGKDGKPIAPTLGGRLYGS